MRLPNSEWQTLDISLEDLVRLVEGIGCWYEEHKQDNNQSSEMDDPMGDPRVFVFDSMTDLRSPRELLLTELSRLIDVPARLLTAHHLSDTELAEINQDIKNGLEDFSRVLVNDGGFRPNYKRRRYARLNRSTNR